MGWDQMTNPKVNVVKQKTKQTKSFKSCTSKGMPKLTEDESMSSRGKTILNQGGGHF